MSSLRVELVDRVDEVRRLGRNRRLRFQLPLGIAGLLFANVSVVASFAGRVTALAGYGMAGGPWLLLLCVLPTDGFAIGLAAVTVAALIAVAGVYHLIPLLLMVECPPSHSQAACDLFVGIDGYAVAVFGVHFVYAVYLCLALLGEISPSYSSWLPARPLRATLTSIWRCVGSVLLWYTPTRFVLGYAESDEPIHDLLFMNENVMGFSRTARAAMAFILTAELIILGSLALWPRLRMTVQSKLASMGEGIATASALSELIGSIETVELIATAERTFRAVRGDQLRPHHLDTNKPAAEAYAISTDAPLGSVDVFLSHSWHDDPAEKWRLLHLWRQQFVKAHGREPTIWLDRCCIDPANLTSLLPCLPIYLAGCDKLLALRGPTFLSRLWCVVELFVFYTMKSDASRIEILEFDHKTGTPARGADGGNAHSTQPHRSRSKGAFERTVSPPPTDAERIGARFDVRNATCVVAEDQDRLLAVIETCGSGFDTFNTWLEALLTRRSVDVSSAGFGAGGRPSLGRRASTLANWVGAQCSSPSRVGERVV